MSSENLRKYREATLAFIDGETTEQPKPEQFDLTKEDKGTAVNWLLSLMMTRKVAAHIKL